MVSEGLALLALFVTLAVIVRVGLRARRRGGGVEDYITARNSQNATTLGLSFLASGMGAWVLFAPPEVGAGVGPVAVGGYAAGAAAPLLAFGLLGPRLRAVVPAGHSLVEFVRLRFGRAFHAYVVAISVTYMLFFVMAELTAVGGVTAILSGADPRVAVVAVAVATVAYT
ncbi:MAG: sodium:solute symporter, partial [Euzebyales bacterium]|nr:sodium:solute symporter [Euzebyales bacterium]